VLPDEPRLKAPVAVAGHVDPQRSVIGRHRLADCAIAVIRGVVQLLAARRITQMVRQLADERALDNRFLESTDRRIELLKRYRPLANELIENLVGNRRQRRVRCETSSVCGASALLMLCPTHELSDTLADTAVHLAPST